MADLRWLSISPAVARVQNYTLSDTWEADDIIRCTIGTVSFDTAAGSTNVTTIAGTLATAWNALTAASFPHFARITASSAATGEFNLTADEEGEEFTVTLTPLESNGAASGGQLIEGGTGATTGTATTANTGPNDLNDPANYSTGAIPVNGDALYFDFGDGTHSAKYNLDALAAVTLVSLNFIGTFTGDVGLPLVNQDYGATEYRPQYLEVGATTINVSTTGGGGSGRLKVNTGSVQTTINVYSTGSPAESDLGAFIWKGTNASNAIRVLDGSVDVAPFGGELATIATLSIEGGSVRTGPGVTLTGCTLLMIGGSLDSSSAIATSSGTITIGNAQWTHRIGGLGGTVTIRAGGTLVLNNPAALTIATLVIESGGTLDVSGALGAVTITTATLRGGSTVNDPGARITHTNPASFPDGLNSVNYTRGGSTSVQFS